MNGFSSEFFFKKSSKNSHEISVNNCIGNNHINKKIKEAASRMAAEWLANRSLRLTNTQLTANAAAIYFSIQKIALPKCLSIFSVFVFFECSSLIENRPILVVAYVTCHFSNFTLWITSVIPVFRRIISLFNPHYSKTFVFKCMSVLLRKMKFSLPTAAHVKPIFASVYIHWQVLYFATVWTFATNFVFDQIIFNPTFLDCWCGSVNIKYIFKMHRIVVGFRKFYRGLTNQFYFWTNDHKMWYANIHILFWNCRNVIYNVVFHSEIAIS